MGNLKTRATHDGKLEHNYQTVGKKQFGKTITNHNYVHD
jgi:hypothetical protein